MSPADEVIERFIAMFGEPKTTNPALFLEEYRKALTGYDGELLHRATDRVMKSATFWPKPAEVLAVVTEIASERYRHHVPEHAHSDLPRRTPEELRAVQEMVDGMKRIFAARQVENPIADVDWIRGQRPGFEEMQRNSPNKGLHMTKEGLSALSKRITGERE